MRHEFRTRSRTEATAVQQAVYDLTPRGWARLFLPRWGYLDYMVAAYGISWQLWDVVIRVANLDEGATLHTLLERLRDAYQDEARDRASERQETEKPASDLFDDIQMHLRGHQEGAAGPSANESPAPEAEPGSGRSLASFLHIETAITPSGDDLWIVCTGMGYDKSILGRFETREEAERFLSERRG